MTEFSTAIEGHGAIITGGARGFGLAIARRLVAAGGRVVLWDRSFDGLDPASAGFDPVRRQVVDMTDPAAVSAAFAEAAAALGQVHILVNNAGITGPVGPSWEYALEDWRRVLAIDLDGVFHGCRAAVPHMRERGYGRIVNVASIAGKEGNANGAAYAAAKGGVIAFSKSVARELVGSGVLVNCLAPAMAQTELLNEMTPEYIAAMKAKIPMGRFLEIQEVAEMVAWVASPACSFTTGFTFDLTGGPGHVLMRLQAIRSRPSRSNRRPDGAGALYRGSGGGRFWRRRSAAGGGHARAAVARDRRPSRRDRHGAPGAAGHGHDGVRRGGVCARAGHDGGGLPASPGGGRRAGRALHSRDRRAGRRPRSTTCRRRSERSSAGSAFGSARVRTSTRAV